MEFGRRETAINSFTDEFLKDRIKSGITRYQSDIYIRQKILDKFQTTEEVVQSSDLPPILNWARTIFDEINSYQNTIEDLMALHDLVGQMLVTGEPVSLSEDVAAVFLDSYPYDVKKTVNNLLDKDGQPVDPEIPELLLPWTGTATMIYMGNQIALLIRYGMENEETKTIEPTFAATNYSLISVSKLDLAVPD